MDREAIEEAIEVLDDASAEMLTETGDENYYGEAITILRQALETEQEPVAHVDHRIHGWPDCLVIKADPPDREDIIRMAREAGLADSNGVVHAFYQLEYFAYLVAEHEREAIWNLLFEYAGRDDLSDSDQSLLKHLSDLIAARWQEWSNKEGEESWIEKK